jgi:hypothetical protein
MDFFDKMTIVLRKYETQPGNNILINDTSYQYIRNRIVIKIHTRD